MAIPHFIELTGVDPYPWQTRLYTQLLRGEMPSSLPLPTGLGKTSAVLLYMLALARGAPLPVRLAYVVDRRTIVDQTAAVVRRWVDGITAIPELADSLGKRVALPTASPPITVGVLRGGLADTGQWRIDPATPAVIVGTVDMLGSRLLFSGYGDGRSRRSLHAGLLGCDTTFFLDEAHLSPAMAELLRTVEQLQSPGWRPPFKAMTMSATPDRPGAAFHNEDDLANAHFRQRLKADKRCTLHEVERQRRVRMVELATAFDTGSILLYCREVKEARALQRDLRRALGKDQEGRVALLTGTLRGYERRNLATGDVWKRFLPERDRTQIAPSVFLVSTSAGEVGVDLDADHAVMDLAPMESMLQRFGRVNRAGMAADTVAHVVYTRADVAIPKDPKTGRSKDPAKFTWRERLAAICHASKELLAALPDVSPAALLALDPQARLAASSLGPGIAPLTADRIELLAATSADLPNAHVDLYLRGIDPGWEQPELQILWRSETDALVKAGDEAARDALSLFPPLPEELLKVPFNKDTCSELASLITRTEELPCIIRDAQGQVAVAQLHDPEALPDLRYATLILPTASGGLSADGLLDGSSVNPVTDHADTDERLRYIDGASGPNRPLPPWAPRAISFRIPIHDEDAEEDEQRWLVYARARLDDVALNAESDVSRLAARQQTVTDHDAAVGKASGQLARALGLPEEVAAAVEAAGGLHDEGKRRPVWQRAAGNRGEPLAKSASGILRPALLGGFRHEFASLVEADRDLPIEDDSQYALRDITLHLIAAHHGFARPGFTNPRQWDPELSVALGARVADEVERRYARLQAQHGPWTLAWLESLVKAADAWVSSGYTPRDT